MQRQKTSSRSGGVVDGGVCARVRVCVCMAG